MEKTQYGKGIVIIMEKFCIITNIDKDESLETTNLIKNYLEAHQKTYVAATEEDLHKFKESGCIDVSGIPDDTECAIVLGGDGTMIQAANDLIGKGIPILGVNLGTLGFLTEVEKPNILMALDALFENRCKIESRIMLEGNVFCGGKETYHGYALNDIVITRSGFSRLINVKIYVNEELINTYLGDGVIISTPTGTTGYNLSAGGPIAAPETKIITITPICPHSLSKRSIIVSSEDKLVVKIGRSKKTQEEEAIATFDGREGIELQTEDIIKISKFAKETKIVKILDKSFFEILRNKLGQDKE